jgi:hypothetical protein
MEDGSEDDSELDYTIGATLDDGMVRARKTTKIAVERRTHLSCLFRRNFLVLAPRYEIQDSYDC